MLLAVGVIRVYQRAISPLFPPSCRFVPSCSQYGVTAIERFGVWRGGWMALRRIGRCHPFHPGGLDPVPDTHDNRALPDYGVEVEPNQ